jgi:hypothetical protein
MDTSGERRGSTKAMDYAAPSGALNKDGTEGRRRTKECTVLGHHESAAGDEPARAIDRSKAAESGICGR